MKKTLIFLALSLLIGTTINAQSNDALLSPDPKSVPIDTSYLDVVYRYQVIDTVIKRKKEIENVVLVGDNYLRYMSWGSVKMDSAWAKLPFEEKSPITQEVRTRHFNLFKQYNVHPHFIITNLKEQTLFYKESASLESYYYEEPVPDFKWTIHDEVTDTVLGYPCKTAECQFRGRKWKAWFTEEIPLPYGPYKFSGLPGMIMKMIDNSRTHKFEAIAITDDKCELRFFPDYAKRYFHTTRERFLKEAKDWAENPGMKIQQSGFVIKAVDSNGKPMKSATRRLFYNPLELE